MKSKHLIGFTYRGEDLWLDIDRIVAVVVRPDLPGSSDGASIYVDGASGCFAVDQNPDEVVSRMLADSEKA